MLKRAARLELLRQYEPLVRKMAGGFQRKLPRNVLREDLIAAGMGGLWDAIRRQRGTPPESFEWYVRVRVRGAILDELRKQDWLPRRARAHANELSAAGGSFVPPPAVVRYDEVSDWEMNRALAEESSSEALVGTRERQEMLAEVVQTLPKRLRFIVDQHYVRGVKFKDIGKTMGVSEPRVSQLHKRAVEHMREELKKHGVRR